MRNTRVCMCALSLAIGMASAIICNESFTTSVNDVNELGGIRTIERQTKSGVLNNNSSGACRMGDAFPNLICDNLEPSRHHFGQVLLARGILCLHLHPLTFSQFLGGDAEFAHCCKRVIYAEMALPPSQVTVFPRRDGGNILTLLFRTADGCPPPGTSPQTRLAHASEQGRRRYNRLCGARHRIARGTGVVASEACHLRCHAGQDHAGLESSKRSRRRRDEAAQVPKVRQDFYGKSFCNPPSGDCPCTKINVILLFFPPKDGSTRPSRLARGTQRHRGPL